MAQPSQPRSLSEKLRVFVSYSRLDLEFADQLVAALTACNFDPAVDRHDIAGGEDWRGRLRDLIIGCDTVVFVLSPGSASSEICGWEVEEAARQNKRLLPVVSAPIDGIQPPPLLQALNYVYFYPDPKLPGSGFGMGLANLVAALNTDVDWIREHTRLGDLAERWVDRERPSDLLLRGSELDEFLNWRTRRPAQAPALTANQTAFLDTSETSERDRTQSEKQRLEEFAAALAQREYAVGQLTRRTVIGGASALVLGTAAAGASYWGYRNLQALEDQRKQALLERNAVEAARTDIQGQLMLYAAAPGELAVDASPNSKDNGPFTFAMIEQLRKRDQSILDAFARAAEWVRNETAAAKASIQLDVQRPYLSSDLNGDIFLWKMPPSRRVRAVVVAQDAKANKFLGVLRNPGNDARVWEALFKAANIPVEMRVNPEMGWTLGALGRAVATDEQNAAGPADARPAASGGVSKEGTVQPNTLTIFVFSGYGAQAGSDQFLLVEPSRIQSTEDFESELQRAKGPNDIETMFGALSLATLTRRLQRSAASIAILDTNFMRLRGVGYVDSAESSKSQR